MTIAITEPGYPKLESGILGSVLMNPDTYHAMRPMNLQASDFNDLTLGRVWTVFEELDEQGIGIDIETVTVHLEQKDELADIGGYARLVGLVADAPPIANPESYGRKVKEAAIRRRMIRYAELTANLAHAGDRTIKDIHEELSRELNSLGGGILNAPTSVRELNDQYVDQLVDHMQSDTVKAGYDTGFGALNHMMGHAYGPSTVNIFGAYTNAGKSFLTAQMAEAAARQGIPTVFITYESSPETINQRLIAARSGVKLDDVMTMAVRGKQAERVFQAAAERNDLPLSIMTLEALSEIEAALQDMSARHDFRPPALFIDSINNLAGYQKGGKDYDRLKNLIPRLMPMALRLKACIVATMQLRIPEGVNAEMSSEKLYKELKPHIKSFEGGSTGMQTASNGYVFWSADWIKQKFNPRFDHLDMTPGYVYFRKLRARDASSDVAEVPLRWNASVPRFEDVELNLS